MFFQIVLILCSLDFMSISNCIFLQSSSNFCEASDRLWVEACGPPSFMSHLGSIHPHEGLCIQECRLLVYTFKILHTSTPLQTGLRFRDGHMSDIVYPWKERPRKGFVQSLKPFGQRLHLGKEFQGLKGGVHALGEHVSLSHGCKRTWKGASLPKAQGPSQFPLRPGLSMAFLPQPNILKATSTFAFLNSHHGLSKPAAITSH